ncbi:hypothetical protein HPB51_017823 [Rhipicephalus microplus]|uniref:Uncharacterized protein n=1 Tax=Rhipicephalus microplus TaxID=6941 RepID=A0A9J6DVN2_RHIMP|nr:hypothetical protein HPB51_017823 [Rhipicephalus microplus]
MSWASTQQVLDGFVCPAPCARRGRGSAKLMTPGQDFRREAPPKEKKSSAYLFFMNAKQTRSVLSLDMPNVPQGAVLVRIIDGSTKRVARQSLRVVSRSDHGEDESNLRSGVGNGIVRGNDHGKRQANPYTTHVQRLLAADGGGRRMVAAILGLFSASALPGRAVPAKSEKAVTNCVTTGRHPGG